MSAKGTHDSRIRSDIQTSWVVSDASPIRWYSEAINFEMIAIIKNQAETELVPWPLIEYVANTFINRAVNNRLDTT